MFRFLAVVLSIIALTSCSGAGNTNLTLHLSEIKSSETRIFIIRSTGYTNAANLIKMTLNGKQLKSIGNKESISVVTNAGSNTLVVSMGGLGSIATREVSRQFTINPGGKKYFVINQDMNLIGATLKLYEVSSEEFLKS